MGIDVPPLGVIVELSALRIYTLQEPAPEKSHDRVKVVQQGHRTVIALADGAGGMSGAAEAAERVVCSLVDTFMGDAVDATPDACAHALAAADQAVASSHQGGESTGLLVVIDGDALVGASVGDCAAWVVSEGDEPHEITTHQMRKPRIGTGRASPVAFGPVPLNGVLVAVTDGVADYLTVEDLTALVRHAASQQLPKTLLDHVRLPSGRLPDHATVLVASPA
jgi:serine/threonine protein phosphatase PrpC